MTRDEFVDVVEVKLNHDPPLRDYLIESFDKIDINGDGNLDKVEIKKTLQMLVKKQNVDIIANNGSFARKYIEKMYSNFEDARSKVDDPDTADRIENPFQEFTQIADVFFSEEGLTSESTVVSGEDLMKMMDISLWYAEKIQDMVNEAVKSSVKMAKNAKNWKLKFEKKCQEFKELEEKKDEEEEEKYNRESEKAHYERLVLENSKLKAKNSELCDEIINIQKDYEEQFNRN